MRQWDRILTVQASKVTLVGLLLLTGCELEEKKAAVTTTTSTTTTQTTQFVPKYTQEEWNKINRERWNDDSLFRRCEVLEEESTECDDYWEGYSG